MPSADELLHTKQMLFIKSIGFPSSNQMGDKCSHNHLLHLTKAAMDQKRLPIKDGRRKIRELLMGVYSE